METSAIDELYGDLGQGHRDSVVNYDEDSVDIYSGLEDSPKKNKHNCKDSTFLSPNRVKESLDLYEELITEEQEEKDATYNELKSKFVAAQNQVQDLFAKLQQMQTKNSSLHQENTLLKKNICALIKTAKMEIFRKDEEISKLSKRLIWGSFHPSAKDRGLEACNGSLASLNSSAGPVRESRDLKGDKGLAEVSQGRPLNQPGDSSSVDATQSSSAVLRRCTRRNLENPLTQPNKDCHGLDSLLNANAQDHRHAQGNRTSCRRERESTNSENSTRQNFCDETDSRKGGKQSGKASTSKEKDISEKSQTELDTNRSERKQRESVKSSCGSGNGRQQHDDPVTVRRSGHSKSPSSYPPHASSSTPDSSRSHADTKSRKEEFRHKQGHERQSGHTEVSGSRSEKSSSDKLHRKTEDRGTWEHHRKEERRQEGMSSSERRRTRSDGIKEYEHRKTQSEERYRPDEKHSNRRERRTTRSETNKEHERRSGKDSGTTRGMGNKADKIPVSDGKDRSHADVHENRRHASPGKPHHSAQNLRKDQDDKRRTSGRTEESSQSKASSSHDNSRGDPSMSSERHSVKECIKGKGRDDKEKRTGTPDKGSKDTADNARIPKISEDGNIQADVLANARRKSPIKVTNSCDSSAMHEESSPKRKLTFMETLNLTVSPIKKQNNSAQTKEPVQPPPEDTLVSNSTKDRSSFEVREEFCIIDGEDDSMDDSLALLTNTAAQPRDKEPPTSLEVKGKELELPKSFGGDLSEAQKMDGTDSEMQECESITKGDDSGVCPTSISQKCGVNKTVVPEVILLPERAKPVDSPCVPLTDVSCKEQDSQASVKKDKERRRIGAKNSREESQIHEKPEASVQNETSQQEVATSIMATTTAKSCSNMDSSVSLEVVSSTVSVENNRQRKEIAVSDMEITQGLENPDPCPGPLVGPSAEAININTTAQEGIPVEQTRSSEPDSTENEMGISRSSRSVVVPHDEDSMMLTLSNIQVIPEAISPLTSPVRQMKKSQQQCLGKEPHVKSLSKDFSTSATVADKDAVKMDMNKENKRPDSLVEPSVQKDQQEALSSTAPEEDLEEGEIISENDGEGTLVIQNPPNEKRSSLRNQPSPRSPRLQKQFQMRPAVTPSRQEQEKNTTSKDSPSSNKRRFKTVTVPPKARISTTAEFMNMLLFIRSELRRKYMKLHKNVTKPAFCCIIEMSQASFTEFVDSVNFDKFCSQGNEIKLRLSKIIASVTNKVSNNGIVNRIFEQRAEDLKQKLWNFVDGQFDFLFKELKAALKGAPDLSKNKSSLESKQSNPRAKEDLNVDLCKLQSKEPLSTTENRPHIKTKGEIESKGQKVQEKITCSNSLPCRSRGLGSSGKNIKATMEEGDKLPEVPKPNHSNQLQAVSSSEKSVQESVPAHENKTPNFTHHLSHSGSIQDRADFEILTEQQTSSLTFNLVTDSQMGDIFRCLLQGSDLLETGDNQNWPLNTPRKEGQAGESLVGVMTPSKMITPSKLITTWTPISPYKLQMPLNPALLDENCMLEVPSNALPNQSASAVATASSQQPLSILAEDLAVSLTIPSPLKSDGHLSFLHPASGQSLSTPSNVISANYSEDALLDGEDATEQDIHLSLETDNSSSPSSTSGNWEATNPAVFQFKPNVPMQAEVMEKSNDHFIVRIRHTSPGIQEEPKQEHKETLPAAEILSSHMLDQSVSLAGQRQVTSKEGSEAEISSRNTSNGLLSGGSTASLPKTTKNLIDQVDDDDATGVTAATESEHEVKTCHRVSRKRKKHHSRSKAKRSRRETSEDKQEKQRHKKRSKSSKDNKEKTPSKKIKVPSPQLSPNSLSAKNVIRKKGEVVVTWTREEDRDILVALKTKGASSKTFVALSSKLRKSQTQIEERFTQLMKLFKKKEKMES